MNQTLPSLHGGYLEITLKDYSLFLNGNSEENFKGYR